MTWATRRKLQYLGGLFIVFFAILFALLYPVIFKKPTCTDGKKNGDEAGVDCGGSCLKMCKETTSDPVILWSRGFKVIGSSYNLVAFIENQNKDAAVENAQYEFRVYDTNNRLIGRQKGSTYIPPNKQFVVFEPRFDAGDAIIKSVTFEFTSDLNWVRRDTVLNNLPILVDNISLGDDKKSPSLSARIKNESIRNIPAFDVIAILYDENRNAINVSKTVKSGIQSNSSIPVYFTWPEAFSKDPILKEVLVQINPFSVDF